MTVAEAHARLTAPGEPFEIEEKVIRGISTRTFRNAPPTLRDVFLNGRRFPDREFLVYENDRATFEGFQRANGLVVDGIIGPQTLAALGISAARAASGGGGSGVSAALQAIAACESGGDPTAVNPAGYYGKYQFDMGTWASVGGSGNPAAAPEAEQDYRASLLYQQAGASPWPVCGA